MLFDVQGQLIMSFVVVRSSWCVLKCVHSEYMIIYEEIFRVVLNTLWCLWIFKNWGYMTGSLRYQTWRFYERAWLHKLPYFVRENLCDCVNISFLFMKIAWLCERSLCSWCVTAMIISLNVWVKKLFLST